ncbi:solute carrier family 22 member 4-like isoform X1 [Nelusetta ayraudi]|uniref:solute carrier family 22 member 4-like isoform X1 n=1 Tax=Nelusetta ayraudi TaxID=303726 RepID=UPI003F717B6A
MLVCSRMELYATVVCEVMAETAASKDYDALTSFLGDYGCFQILMMVLLSLSAVPPGYMGVLAVFVADTPGYRCRAPPLNSTLNDSGSSSSATTPGPDSCSRYRLSCNGTGVSNDTETCAHGWDYSTDVYINTIVTEWDLVCDNAWKVPMSTSLFFLGFLAGCAGNGHASDRFGRKKVFFLTTILHALTALLQAASVNWIMFAILNLLRGYSQNYSVSHILGSELLGKSSRVTFCLIGHCIGYAVGYAMLPLLAYFIRSWRMLQVASAIPSLLLLPLWWVIPESPRWLLHQGHVEEAEHVIRNAAKINKISAPDVIFNSEDCLEFKKVKGENQRKYSYMDFMHIPNLRNTVIVGFFLCVSVNIVFYGMSLNTSNLTGNIYLNCFTSAVIEIVAYVANWPLIKWFPRPTVICCTMMFSGVMLMFIQLVPEGIHFKALPFLILGLFSIVAAASSMLLPDTRNSKLPDLISQTRPIRSCCSQKESGNETTMV